MKKILIASLLVLSIQLKADYFITWSNSDNPLTTDGIVSNPLLPTIGNKAILQLWFAGVNGIDSILFNNNTTNGDDQLLSSVVFENTDGNVFKQYAVFTNTYGGSGTTFLGPSVYMRVIKGDVINIGSQYMVSALRTVNNLDFSSTPPPADTIEFADGTEALGLTAVVQAIPEPGTLALIGASVSMVIFGLRRRRYRI